MLELLPSPDYFERAFGRRNPPIPGARLWNAGRNRLYVANDDPLFSRQLSFLRDDILARIGESRCAKRHRERDGRAPGQPTEPVERSHGGYSAAFFLARQEKPTAKEATKPAGAASWKGLTGTRARTLSSRARKAATPLNG